MGTAREIFPSVLGSYRLPIAKDVIADLLTLRRVLRVEFTSNNEERDVRSFEFVLLKVVWDFQERRVRGNGGFDDVVECEVEDVSRAEAVPDRTERRDSPFLETSDHLVERRTRLVRPMFRKPRLDVELWGGRRKWLFIVRRVGKSM